MKFPYIFIYKKSDQSGLFGLFYFTKLVAPVRPPDEYKWYKDLTAEEIGQIMGGN